MWHPSRPEASNTNTRAVKSLERWGWQSRMSRGMWGAGVKNSEISHRPRLLPRIQLVIVCLIPPRLSPPVLLSWIPQRRRRYSWRHQICWRRSGRGSWYWYPSRGIVHHHPAGLAQCTLLLLILLGARPCAPPFPGEATDGDHADADADENAYDYYYDGADHQAG